MHTVPDWRVEVTKILTRSALLAVLDDLAGKAKKSATARLNLVIFRLASCCGLRVSEIANLRLDDVRVELVRPHLRLRPGTTKGGRGRIIPLWWDGGTLGDLAAWKAERLRHGATVGDPFVVSLRCGHQRTSLTRATIRRRFLTACKVLGLARLRTLTIHHGRHTFISHALAGGRSLAEVRDAAGHANVSVTSCYLHVAVEEDEVAGSLFGAR